MNDNTKEHSRHDISVQVMDRIEREHVVPRARWKFEFIHYALLALWGAAVCAGAAVTSALLFVFSNVDWYFYPLVYGSPTVFFFKTLPSLWIIMFALFLCAAYYTLRHTKRGYRFPMPAVLAVSVLGSMFGGLTLYGAGFGYVLDQQIGEHIPFHNPILVEEQRAWTDPERGLLLGEVLTINEEDKTFQLQTFEGQAWTVYGGDLDPMDWQILPRFRHVRLVGLPMVEGNAATTFRACFVFPWEVAGDIPGMPAPFPSEEMMLMHPPGELPPDVFPPLETNLSLERSNECRAIEPYGMPFINTY